MQIRLRSANTAVGKSYPWTDGSVCVLVKGQIIVEKDGSIGYAPKIEVAVFLLNMILSFFVRSYKVPCGNPVRLHAETLYSSNSSV